MRNHTTTKHNRGFTLIEVLIAVGIIAGIVTFAAITLNNTNQGVRQSSHQLHAQEQANNALENVRARINTDGTICTAPAATTSTHAGQTFTTRTTLRHVRSTDSTQDTFDSTSTVACDEAQAVRVNVLVTWDEESGSTARHELNSSISLVSLNAPQILASSFTPTVVAQGAPVTITWDEGDTLPIPRYTLTHPTSPTTHMGTPSTVPAVIWTGPDTWVGSPNSRTGTIRTEYGEDPMNPETLELSVTRDRINTLEFTAQRSGRHVLEAQNITDSTGTTAIESDLTVVMRPTMTFEPASNTIQYGSYPGFIIPGPGDGANGFYNGGYDSDYSFTLRGTNNDFINVWENTPPPNPTSLFGYPFPPPTTFPAWYEAWIDNTYTEFHGHEPNVNHFEREVRCLPPRLLGFRQGPSTVTAGGLFNMYVEIHPENVPDGRLVIIQNGTPLPFDPPLVNATGDTEIIIPPGNKDPITIEFPYVAGPVGTDRLEFHISSATCNDPTPPLHADVRVEGTPPPTGSTDALPTATCNATIGVHMFDDWNGIVTYGRSYTPHARNITETVKFNYSIGGRTFAISYPIEATYIEHWIEPASPPADHTISGDDETITLSNAIAVHEVYEIHEVSYAFGSPVNTWGAGVVGTTRSIPTCIDTITRIISFPPVPLPPCEMWHTEEDIINGVCEP